MLTARDLRMALADKLPDYMVPPVVVFLDSLPRTINGKVNRAALPAVPVRQALGEVDLPTDQTEERMLKIWKKEFHLEKISVLDSFFDLGGDSLMPISLFLNIEHEFSRMFPSSILLESPTIRSLSQILRSNERINMSSVIPIKSGGSKTPVL